MHVHMKSTHKTVKQCIYKHRLLLVFEKWKESTKNCTHMYNRWRCLTDNTAGYVVQMHEQSVQKLFYQKTGQ